MYVTCACQDKSEQITTPRSLKLFTLSIILPLAMMLGTEFMSVFVPKWMSSASFAVDIIKNDRGFINGFLYYMHPTIYEKHIMGANVIGM